MKIFPSMEKLNLSHRANLTMFSLRHLRESPSLREVKLYGFTGPASEYAENCRVHFRLIQQPCSASFEEIH